MEKPLQYIYQSLNRSTDFEASLWAFGHSTFDHLHRGGID